MLGVRRVPFAPNELRTAIGVHDIAHGINLVFNIKPHRDRIVRIMFAACYGNARIYVRIYAIFVIARRDLDFLLFFLVIIIVSFGSMTTLMDTAGRWFCRKQE